MYNVCMNKKRINMYLEAEDRRMISFLREKYGLDSEASAVRFLIRKVAKEEGYVPGETGPHRQDRPTR
jgi:sulfur relay (sulfurtransferase) DsrC/TusE family protein